MLLLSGCCAALQRALYSTFYGNKLFTLRPKSKDEEIDLLQVSQSAVLARLLQQLCWAIQKLLPPAWTPQPVLPHIQAASTTACGITSLAHPCPPSPTRSWS
jgi:hypothetical protein